MNKLIKRFQTTIFTSYRLLFILWSFDKKIFIGSFLAISLPAVIPFINAYIYKLIIDLVISSINGASPDYTHLYYLLGFRILTLLAQDLSYNLQSYFDTLLWTKFPIHLYQQVLSKISNLDVPHFENSQFKNKLEKVKDSYHWKPLNLITNLLYTAQSALQIILSFVAIFYLNCYLIIPIIVSAIFRLLVQTKMAEVSWGIWSDQSPYRKKYWYLSDLIQGGHSIKEIKIFQLGSHFLNELKNIYNQFAKENSSHAFRELLLKSLSGLFDITTYIGIEIYIILSALSKKISIGDTTYYTTVVSSFQNGLSGFFRNVSHVYENGLYVQDIFDLLDTSPIILEPKDGIKIDSNKPPRIEFQNISFKYPDSSNYTLKNFSLVIEPGQKIALVGENGVGKSTIIKLLSRFYDVTEGKILINGHDIKDLDLDSWHKSLGILFQDFIKYEYTVSDNIYFGRVFDKRDEDNIIKAAQESGADQVAETLPNQYNQLLGKTFEGGSELSTGQWQKVALARAFLRNAPTLILDEPTAAIDAKAEYEIFEKVEKLSKDKTVIIISHRFSTVRNADQIYVIKDGSTIESGNHTQLLKEKGVYAKLFQLQARGYK